MNPLAIVILAAGRGKRMNSIHPKVLQPLAGKPLLGHVLQTAAQLSPRQTLVVHGHGADAVRSAFTATPLTWVLQEPQLGTGHAVRQCLPQLADDGTVLVLYGDVPLISAATLNRLLAIDRRHLALLTVHLQQPDGYGRIVRNAAGAVQRIVEDRDASDAERSIGEVNTGIMAIPAARLAGWLDRLSCDNAQQEYYLTDLVALAISDGVEVHAVQPDSPDEVLGVNDRRQLATLERIAQARIAEQLLAAGVTLFDPCRLDVRGSLSCGRDVQIDVNCVFEGEVDLGDGVTIGAHCVIRQSRIAAGTRIAPFSHIDGAVVAGNVSIGPFARLRPGAELADGVHIGNFVEVKKSRVGAGSKVNHLTYIGDSDIGARVNVGAGTITCNYDGVNKYRTVIQDDVFVGSGCMLVAPLTIGRGATLGAGSTITKPAPDDALTVTRAKQVTVPGWQRPKKV